jgi:hypothetical protein
VEPGERRRGIARFLVEEYFLTRHLIRRFRTGMSALETFVRARHYKDRAAEFFELAGQPLSEEVRARYLAIADHYMALADAEIRTDQLIRRKRLDLTRSEREKSQRAADITPNADLKVNRREAPRAPEPARLRLVKSGKRLNQLRSPGPAQMAAQSDFAVVKSAR